MHNLSLFIFRRDIRLDDNTGLISALSESKSVIPLFICTPTQVSDQNKYKSSNAIQFMIESLYDLNQQIRDLNPRARLLVMYGNEIDIINKLYKKFKFDAIYVNEDYTPYSIKRDKSIKKFCDEHDLSFNSKTDILLLDTNDIAANNGNRYHIFTQFYNKALTYPIRKPNYDVGSNFKAIPTDLKKWTIKNVDKFLLKKGFYEINDDIAIHGGRENGLHILRTIKKFHTYKKTHDIMSKPTTMLSAHNKFGTVSIRECYKFFKDKAKSEPLVRQLYWRDFYYSISTYFAESLYSYKHITKKHNPKSKAKWDNNKKFLKAWTEGKTGFPIVDAAMRELNVSGFMHNRARMCVSNFLCKDLLIDWKYGERYFTQKLVDVDRCQNIGNWNFCSSYGLDAASFLRIFNPWTQSKKFDPDCEYIKKWLPELSEIPNEYLHQWDKYHELYPEIDYPKPIVEHDIQRKKFIKFYKSYFK